MTNMKNRKIRTVTVNARGQIVIPEDIRRDFGITGESTLVMIERNGEIVLKRDSDVLEALEGEDKFWEVLATRGMKKAWEKEDAIWDKFYQETSKEASQ